MLKRLLCCLLLSGATAVAGYDALSVSGEWLINGYKAVISPLQGQNICNFWPTCSQFTKAAIRSQGIVLGSVMGADRLMRCNPFAWSYADRYYYGVSHDRLQDPPSSHLCTVHPDWGAGSRTTIAPESTGSVPGHPDSPGAPAADVRFADHLYASGDYTQAATEYLRVRFATTRPALRNYAGLMAAESYLRAGDPELSLRGFRDVSNPDIADYARYGSGRALFAAGRYADARPVLDSIPTSPLRDHALILTGWSHLKEHRFADAAAVFRSTSDPAATDIAAFDGTGLRRRNRVLSSLMSTVVPGSGQVYSGRLGDGLYSFLTVVTTGLTTWWFASHVGTLDKDYVKTSIFGALTLLFHAGNVYGACVAARDYNTLQERLYLARAEELLTRLRLEPDYRPLPGADSLDFGTPGDAGN